MRPDDDCTQPLADLVDFPIADPQPAVTFTGDGDAMALRNFRDGDARPVGAGDRAWFRVYRMTRADCAAHLDRAGSPSPIRWSPALFILTCGAGATQGFRSWVEVQGDAAGEVFAGDPALFTELQASEWREWFAVEWSPAGGGNVGEHYGRYLPDDESAIAAWNGDYRTHSFNHGGSFRWIQRLEREPPQW